MLTTGPTAPFLRAHWTSRLVYIRTDSDWVLHLILAMYVATTPQPALPWFNLPSTHYHTSHPFPFLSSEYVRTSGPLSFFLLVHLCVHSYAFPSYLLTIWAPYSIPLRAVNTGTPDGFTPYRILSEVAQPSYAIAYFVQGRLDEYLNPQWAGPKW